MLTSRISRRRGTAAIAGVLAVTALAGGAGIASAGNGSPKGDAAAAKAAASGEHKQGVGPPTTGDPGVPQDLLAATRRGLDALVADGTIDQSQADAVQSRVASGTVDTSEVISSGVLNEAQMARVNDVLRAIKLSFAGQP